MVNRKYYTQCLSKKRKNGKQTISDFRQNQKECSFKDLDTIQYLKSNDFDQFYHRFDDFSSEEFTNNFSKKELRSIQEKIDNRVKYAEDVEHKLVRSIDREGNLSNRIQIALNLKRKK